jgi:hypothetical protein
VPALRCERRRRLEDHPCRGEDREQHREHVEVERDGELGQVAGADELEVGGTGTEVDCPTAWFAPRKNSMPARVTMNAGTYERDPEALPGAHERAEARPEQDRRPPRKCQSAMDWTTMPTKAATEPTERSMWP